MDFSLILFVASVVTGIIWLFDSLVLAPKRKLAVAVASGVASAAGAPALAKPPAEPVLVEWAKSFFPVLIIIFFLRSFLYEPFRIPSGSMKPTLTEGDFILVNKFSYGIRLPVLNRKIIETSQPQRGDVAVFRYPENPAQDYIKRIVGLPGDRVMYSDKTITVQPFCPAVVTPCPEAFTVRRELVQAAGFDDNGALADIWQETLGERTHRLLIHPRAMQPMPYYGNENVWTVPDGHYFVMGDNRDRSHDGRFWGFVPDSHLKGRAVAVWLHLDFGIETPFLSWIPTGISFSRIGGID